MGEVTNQGEQATKFVKVAGAFYNDQNQVVAVGFSYTDRSDLAPGMTAPFEIIVSEPAVEQIKSAKLNVQSEDYSMILTTTTESTEMSSILEENGIRNEQGSEEP